MSAQDKEIEIRFEIKNPETVIAFLDQQAKLINRNIFQRDTYYTPAHKDFLAKKYPYQWLRLRETEKATSFDYKHYYPENTEVTDYCDEFEVKVDKPETLKKILKALDFKQSVVVEKTRGLWLYKEVAVAVDQVKGLGNFIELEVTHHFPNPKDGKQYLYQIIKEIKAELGAENIRGYPCTLLAKQGYKF